ncbi:hypothetical protein ACQ5SP_14590 [Rhodovulum sp. YNF3179]|uniref:hypothetical protein n=1 Tax=Rhodovulum sp. YNF3179 TaxID=3425127 RepID=UPI003D34FFD4
MAINREHELHGRRKGRNLGLGLVLAAFVLIVFGITIAKMSGGAMMEAYDHTVRPSLMVEDE